MKNAKIQKQYKWNLKLLYKSDTDKQIEKDLQETEKLCADFNQKYKDIDFDKNPELLKKLLEEYEKINDINLTKPLWYFSLKSDIENNNKIVEASKNRIKQRITKALNNLAFFELNIAKIQKENQDKIIENENFKYFRYFLKKIFDKSKYNLTEKEEKMQNLLSQTSYSMWVDAGKKQITEKSVKHKGKNISLSEAFGIIPNLKRGERAILKKKIYEKLKEASFIAEAEINAVFSYKKITDELRGFTKPYEETVLKYENELSVVENLVDQVTKNFNISKKFYKIHSKLLKLKKIATYDTNIEISKINKKFDFQESVKIVAKSLRDFKPEYEKILLDFVKNGQIDSHPRIYKRGGAYNWGNNLLSTFLLLNHTDEIRSVETLAHEIGHAIHTELTKKQGGLYRDYSVSTAETASTFFEQVASLEIEKYLDKKDKITFLHHNIKNDIITIFKQIACFNFEKELHQKIRTDGFVTKDQIAKLLNKHTKSCIGDVLQQEDEDGYFFVSWSHIRSFFYVYSYAFGQLTSKALFKKWKEDKTFADKIEIFLKAGSSKSPEDIFKDMGIDLRDPEFFKIGLESIADDIKRLEKMIKQK